MKSQVRNSAANRSTLKKHFGVVYFLETITYGSASPGRDANIKIKKKATNAKKLAKPKQAQVRSKAARAHIAEGTRLFALAGRPTKVQFVKVYGPQGPKVTWEQRAKADVDAKHFQAALAGKGGS